MTLRVARRPRAYEDLRDLWRYIAEDNEAAADRLLDRIDAALQMLAEHPEAGRRRPEVASGLYSFPVGSCVLFYRIRPTELLLVRVLSGYRDVDGIDFTS